MKFKEFVENVSRLLENRPELGDFEAVTSKDDEGNGFNIVYFEPSLGYFDGDEFTPEDEEELKEEINAVCIN